ncbi:hypothetical protein ABIB54_000220 [Frigoribacterium sp. UYMn621]
MPWYKVDDGLSMKAETTRIPRAARTSAIGLLALAGSWSARELTDGHIPTHMLEELAGSEADASWLVTAGFWIAVVDGWRFTEWEPDQPLREVVLADRAKRAEKMRGWRSRNQASSTPSNPATNSATNADSDATVPEPQPVPTRPDPDLSKKKEHVQKPAHDYSKEFDEFWSLYPRKQGKADAVKAYARARKTTEAKTLRDGAQAYSLMSIGANKNHIKLPGGWIREERWNDEPIAAIPSPLAKDERIIDVLEQGRRFQGDVRLAPEARMRQTLALGSSLTMLTPNSFCEIHPDYPFEIDGSCTACARSVGLAPRVAF